MTKQEKQIQWLFKQGYPHNREEVKAIDKAGWTWVREFKDTFLGIVKNEQFIPMPQFDDDKPEPVDKALQKWIREDSSLACVEALQEINNRLKALEAKAK